MLVILRTVITKKKKVGLVFDSQARQHSLCRSIGLDGELEEGEVEEEIDEVPMQKDGMYAERRRQTGTRPLSSSEQMPRRTPAKVRTPTKQLTSRRAPPTAAAT